MHWQQSADILNSKNTYCVIFCSFEFINSSFAHILINFTQLHNTATMALTYQNYNFETICDLISEIWNDFLEEVERLSTGDGPPRSPSAPWWELLLPLSRRCIMELGLRPLVMGAPTPLLRLLVV